MYELNDLQKIQAKGDNLESFHNTWIMVTSALQVMPSDDILEHLYDQQIKNMKVLSDDIAYYNRQERGEINLVTGKCEKTYQFPSCGEAFAASEAGQNARVSDEGFVGKSRRTSEVTWRSWYAAR